MRPYRLLIMTLCASLLFGACAPAAGDLRGSAAFIKDAKLAEADREALARMQQNFAFRMLKELGNQDHNLVFSPYSLYQALLMTEAGASGETDAEMRQVLGIESAEQPVHAWMNAVNADLLAPDENLELKVANALWPQVDARFEQAFLDTLSKYYNAGMTPLNYQDPEAARQLINAWVEKQTESRIKELIAQDVLDVSTRLVLTNAIYFKSAWQNAFSAVNAEIPFYGPDSRVSYPAMMENKAIYAYSQDENLTVVKLPYAAEGKSMVLLMPREGGMEQLAAELTPERWQSLLTNLHSNEAILTLPKFKFESSFSLAGVLSAMGMPRAFTQQAEFARMSSAEELYISAVLHKAEVEAEEEGTTASAASAVVMAPKSAPMPAAEPLRITIDHPFLFAIYAENTGQLLFLGRVSNP